MRTTPVAVFAFNRPNHLERLLDSLIRNKSHIKDTPVYLFIDGPRNLSDEKLVNDVSEIAKRKSKSINLEINRSEINMGLSNSIITGINKVLEVHERIIVLEDDLITNSEFLSFCNRALDLYENNLSVGSIQGYSENVRLNENSETYFQRGADCWGWATWKSRWDNVEWDGEKLLKNLKEHKLEKIFDYNGAFPYTGMLARQTRGEVDSWAIRWHASMFLDHKLSLYPVVTLIENTGRDGSGTHGGSTDFRWRTPVDHAPKLGGIEIAESKEARKKLERIYRSRNATYSCYSPKKYYYFLARHLKKAQ